MLYCSNPRLWAMATEAPKAETGRQSLLHRVICTEEEQDPIKPHLAVALNMILPQP